MKKKKQSEKKHWDGATVLDGAAFRTGCEDHSEDYPISFQILGRIERKIRI
ncbi:MAG: hypothetical protein LUD81_07285 [Clostridiales bacterium]|nr:hypothetical protein [Clostridiales bacterium]